jgi:hypothetical protein
MPNYIKKPKALPKAHFIKYHHLKLNFIYTFSFKVVLYIRYLNKKIYYIMVEATNCYDLTFMVATIGLQGRTLRNYDGPKDQSWEALTHGVVSSSDHFLFRIMAHS